MRNAFCHRQPFVGLYRCHNYRRPNLGLIVQKLQHFPAADVRHVNIQHHDIGMYLFGIKQKLIGIGCRKNLITARFQKIAVKVEKKKIIIKHKNPAGVFFFHIPSPANSV